MELKSRTFRSKVPQVATEPRVAYPCSRLNTISTRYMQQRTINIHRYGHIDRWRYGTVRTILRQKALSHSDKTTENQRREIGIKFYPVNRATQFGNGRARFSQKNAVHSETRLHSRTKTRPRIKQKQST